MISRREWLLSALLAADARAQPQVVPRALAFPRDHGSHDDFRIEWWYVTGELRSASSEHGFQVTFFRSRTGVPGSGRFAPRQLLFAHAALSDVAHRKLLHAQRIARWNGDAAAPLAASASSDTRVHIGTWRLARDGGRYTARVDDRDAGFAFELALVPSQPLMLQGDAGFSRKGPELAQASHYVSEPQLRVQGELVRGGQREPVTGTAWLDHEWSETLMHPAAVGWDWIGMNLDDGGALMAFRLRRADGSTLWAGGTHRTPDGTTRVFDADQVRFIPGRRWTSAATRASYPVEWEVQTPGARFTVRARFDAQELDSRASTGTVYWEGLSDLLDAADGRRLGRGYLEMTGYAQPLTL